MKIRIFDFDWTITRYHTFNNAHLLHPETNTKDGINALFLHDAVNIAAIASYHTDPDYIKRYVEFILGATLTLKERLDVHEDHVLSVYTIESLHLPVVISTIKPDDFNARITRLRETGKNTQISHVLAYLNTAAQLSEQVDVEFYDDDENNVRKALTMANPFSLTVCLIDRLNQREVVIKERRQAGKSASTCQDDDARCTRALSG